MQPSLFIRNDLGDIRGARQEANINLEKLGAEFLTELDKQEVLGIEIQRGRTGQTDRHPGVPHTAMRRFPRCVTVVLLVLIGVVFLAGVAIAFRT